MGRKDEYQFEYLDEAQMVSTGEKAGIGNLKDRDEYLSGMQKIRRN